MGKTRRKFRKKRGKTKRKYSKVNRRYKRRTLKGRRRGGVPKYPTFGWRSNLIMESGRRPPPPVPPSEPPAASKPVRMGAESYAAQQIINVKNEIDAQRRIAGAREPVSSPLAYKNL